MKLLTTLISALSAPASEGTVRTLVRMAAILIGAVVAFSVGFQVLMSVVEGRDHTWASAVYWTVVTMTTLGYGDIVFESDVGRLYSLLVLVAGAVLILVMLPFTFIQLVYLPWREAVRRASAPRELPEDTEGHVVVTGLGPIEQALIRRVQAAGMPYVLLVDDVDEGLRLHDAGYRVAVGAMDDPDTYRRIRADRAALVFAARSDTTNTNVVFTLREISERCNVVATAASVDSVDILELAGCDRVLRLGELLGEAFARRILAPTARSSIISTFEDLVIAETSAAGTELVGRSVGELDLRERFGVSVVGLWDRGALQVATPELMVEESSIVLLAGTRDQLAAYDDAMASDEGATDRVGREELVLILGGGRVGRATARALGDAGIRCRVVERLPERIREGADYVLGDAADREVLDRAGITEASAVVITTHDDDVNLYLTLYCRRLRPDAEILGRVNVDQNLSTMHRAGADFVLSYASTGATEVWNVLRHDSTLLLAEGLVVFRTPVPAAMAGRPLADAGISAATGCTVIAIREDGRTVTDPDPATTLPADGELVIIGDDRAEERFLNRFVAGERGAWQRVRERLARSGT